MKKSDPFNRIKYLLKTWGKWKYARYAKSLGYSSRSPIANFGMPRTGSAHDSEVPNGTQTEVAWLDVIIDGLEPQGKQIINCTYAMCLSQVASADLLGFSLSTIKRRLTELHIKLEVMLHEARDV